MNAFVDILRQAHEKKWCMQTFCTTCGSMEYRNALAGLARQEGNQLVSALATLELPELYRYPDWDDALRLALYSIQDVKEMDTVLTGWLPQLDRNIRVADLVLFYYVRRGALFAPMSLEVLQQWREKCIDIAVRTADVSLVESLICTVGDYDKYPELAEVVSSMAERGSYTILKALRRHNG